MKQDKWLYTVEGLCKGPLNSTQIAELVLEGILNQSDLVQSYSSGLWIRIKDSPQIQEHIHKPLGKPLTDEGMALRFRKAYTDLGSEDSWIELDFHPLYYNTNWRFIPLWNLLSLGLFGVYWLFRQWTAMEKLCGRKRRSFVEVGFLYIYAISIVIQAIDEEPQFRQVRTMRQEPKLLIAMFYIGLSMAILPIGLLAGQSVFINWLVTIAPFILITLPMVFVQKYINECNHLLGRSSIS